MIRPRVRSRPFTIVDGAILLLGLALAVFVAIWFDPLFLEEPHLFRGFGPPRSWLPIWAVGLDLPMKRATVDATAALIPVSLAVALATFRRPIGGCRRVGGSPGLTASAVVAVAVVAEIAIVGLDHRSHARHWEVPAFWIALLNDFQFDVSAPVGAAWAYQGVGRLWHPRDDWRDWLGRWLGGAWLGLIGLGFLHLAIWG